MMKKKRILTERHLKAFRAYLIQEEKSKLTIEKYLRDVRKFMVFAADRQVTRELASAYKDRLQKEKYADRSINSMLASLNSLLVYLGWDDCKVKHLRAQRQLYCREPLERYEYIQLLKASGKETRLNLVMQTICSTGIRISELVYFTVEAVREGEIQVRCKGKSRKIFIPDRMRKKLLAYAEKNGIDEGPVFVTKKGKPLDRSPIWRQMKRLCEAAGVKPSKVFPHNLRKLFARTFYKLEKDMAKLADLLGHGSIETTRIYIMETGEEHRRKIEKLGLVV